MCNKFVGSYIAMILVAAAFCCSSSHSETIHIGDRNQIFIDGRYLESVKNVGIEVCKPIKTNDKCLVGSLDGYSSIIEPDGKFRMWSALTKDGVNWRRVSGATQPEPDDILGAYFSGATMFVDPKAPPSERYKLFDGLQNMMRASADGTDWKTLSNSVFPQQARYLHGMDSQNVCFYDTRINKYVAYVRVNKIYECPPERVPYYKTLGTQRYGGENKYARRTIGRAVSDDPTKFPMPEVVLEPDDKDPNFGGVKVMDFYCPQVVQYPHAQDAYFLFNCRYRSYEDWYLPIDMSKYPKSKTHFTYNCGVEDMELDASRDGINWERYDRKPWIALGKPGSFDALTMYMSRGMHVVDDEIWMYYIGFDDPHTGNAEAMKHATLSRVVLRKDGFTCVEAEYAGGEFTTPPLNFDGNTLNLNIETSAIGLARVEIQDEAGNPLPGFAMEDCDRIHTANSTDWKVTWGENGDLSKLAAQPVRLRFELQFGTKLYAFRFPKSTAKQVGRSLSVD
ncbi:hypothetical protein Pla52o_52420 [Novipirellula galeiformis]|uniref:Uncharacterized protein n=1 Tax=Novipirellula galeiformis TaxID=2528004 RepID=A0A5C6BZY3_9BACT|nr:hypothetical protein [Novipirellula galeiformis]TWU17438.1 hypothetical protein Pla52o_52420 [Novipirellula galeiformis]